MEHSRATRQIKGIPPPTRQSIIVALFPRDLSLNGGPVRYAGYDGDSRRQNVPQPAVDGHY